MAANSVTWQKDWPPWESGVGKPVKLQATVSNVAKLDVHNKEGMSGHLRSARSIDQLYSVTQIRISDVKIEEGDLAAVTMDGQTQVWGDVGTVSVKVGDKISVTTKGSNPCVFALQVTVASNAPVAGTGAGGVDSSSSFFVDKMSAASGPPEAPKVAKDAGDGDCCDDDEWD